jgi:hypothetical protein
MNVSGPPIFVLEEPRAMPEQPSTGDHPDPPVADSIEDLARRVREAEHLEPGTRAQVADLLGNLAAELDQAEPSAQKELLTQTTTQLVQAVHDRHDPGLIEAARERLEEVVARAETKAPVATDVVLQLIDLLARLGI